jgi:hypothetical protein
MPAYTVFVRHKETVCHEETEHFMGDKVTVQAAALQVSGQTRP